MRCDMENNYVECVSCKHMLKCTHRNFKARDCLYYEEREEIEQAREAQRLRGLISEDV